MELSQDQEKALAALLAFAVSNEPAFGLFGSAGTGKTTVIKYFLRAYRDLDIFRCVYLSAPTHKAVGVISDSLETSSSRVKTVHSLLGLKRTIKEGREVFLPNKNTRDRIYQQLQNSLIIVDECSMVSEELVGFLMEAARNTQAQVVFMGDPYQLPPISEKRSQTFDLPSPKSQVLMTQVMRHGGVLFETVDGVRNAILTEDRMPFLQDAEDDLGSVIVGMNRKEWANQLIVDIKDGRSAKALAWRNSVVDSINNWIRQSIYGEDAERWVVGEHLVAVESFENTALVGNRDKKGIVMHTEEECEVLSARTIKWEGLFPCWVVEVACAKGGTYEIRTLDETQTAAYKEQLALQRKSALKTRKWSDFYYLKDSFTKLRPPFATTVHKSQGSTYDRVYVHRSDLRLNKVRYESSRLLYVAYSRAREGLFIT